jgi:hypothetical protein
VSAAVVAVLGALRCLIKGAKPPALAYKAIKMAEVVESRKMSPPIIIAVLKRTVLGTCAGGGGGGSRGSG